MPTTRFGNADPPPFAAISVAAAINKGSTVWVVDDLPGHELQSKGRPSGHDCAVGTDARELLMNISGVTITELVPEPHVPTMDVSNVRPMD